MKIQIIVLTEQQKNFLESDADLGDIDHWLETQTKTAPVVEVFVREEGTAKESVWGLSPAGVNAIEREIEDVIVTEQEMNAEEEENHESDPKTS